MIITERLRLEPFNQQLLEAAVSGDAAVFEKVGFTPNAKWLTSDIRTRANGFLSLIALGGSSDVLPWMIVLKDENEIIGDIGFTAAEEAGTLEIGYGIAKPYRRNHFASEAIRALTWHHFMKDKTLLSIQAAIERVNAPSRHCIALAGYRELNTAGHLVTYQFERENYENWFRSLSPNGLILASACLLDFTVRYNAEPFSNELTDKIKATASGTVKVPCCPEQLGGLSTPRAPVEFNALKACYLNHDGEDVSAAFERGAEMVVQMATQLATRVFILKQNSPSCGSIAIYDGNFSGQKCSGSGCTVKKIMTHFEKYVIVDENGHMLFQA
jgi:uncharacterized protein YbbK (DUF523 family)/RimJ/RimL family protein N-acetyltransferase